MSSDEDYDPAADVEEDSEEGGEPKQLDLDDEEYYLRGALTG